MSTPPLNSHPLRPSGKPPPGVIGDEAQPLRPKAKAQSRAVRASRIPSAFAEDVDEANQRKASGDDGFALRWVELNS